MRMVTGVYRLAVLRRRLAIPAAVLAALAVAEIAVLIMMPRDDVIDPARVEASTFFTEAQLDRARDFRRPQLALYGGTILVQAAVLVALVVRPPRRLRGEFRRPVLAGGVVGAGIACALVLAPLPLTAIAHQRAVDVGLSTRSWGGWAFDVVRSTAIQAVLAALGAMLAVWLMRRFPRRWWIPGSVAVVALSAVFVSVSPVVLDPLVNRFEPLPRGPLRSEVFELADRAGVDVGQVYSMNASVRTSGANAYVAGLGHTKRVVLYDNLIEGFPPREVGTVVTHELAHVHFHDVPRGLLYIAIVTPLGLLAAALLTRRLSRGRTGPAALPALALSLAAMTFAITIISNQLSRAVEARADAYALRLTDDARAFIAFERRIAVKNVSDPDPPGFVTFLLGTHPPVIERIGMGVAFQRGAR
jgi:STE24 endopeptidase